MKKTEGEEAAEEASETNLGSVGNCAALKLSEVSALRTS